MAKKKETFYIRIGRWRPDEISFNYAEGRIEAGVSVFEAVRDKDRLRILLDFEHDPDSRQIDTLSGWVARIMSETRREKEPTPIFVVSGRRVGTGFDGEPLLKELEVEAEISLDRLKAPEVGLK